MHTGERRRMSVGRRWRIAAVSAVILGVLWVPTLAIAHPLGNFTINTAAAVIARVDEVIVDYVVDMAEIPTLQERGRLDLDGDDALSTTELEGYRIAACDDLRAGLRLRVDGALTPLAVRSTDLSLPVGQAGLSTLRLRCLLATTIGRAPSYDLVLEDRNFPDRLGWREMTAVGDGTTIARSDVPTESPSQRLTAYPKNVRTADIRSATIASAPEVRACDRRQRVGRQRRPPEGSWQASWPAPICRPGSSP
jgi:nickel/cobalt transporter (NicO) family protein